MISADRPRNQAMPRRPFCPSRLRAKETLELFVRVFSASSPDRRGTEHERMLLVPLVFGLLPNAALARRTADERIKPAIRAHLDSLGILYDDALVDTLKDVADQYFSAVLKSPGERARKLGVEAIRAFRTDAYARLRERQANRCAICGVLLGKDTVETLDHILPWSLVGDRFDGSNWQLLCGACNMGKREWLSALQSQQALNWHYGSSDALPLTEPTLEARYLTLAIAGKCQATNCNVSPRNGRLTVVRMHPTGLAVADNLAAMCEDHARDGLALELLADQGTRPPPPLPTSASELPGEFRVSRQQPQSAGELHDPAASSRTLEPPITIVIAEKFHGYALLQRVTGGGMAECFLALDEETSEEVFLKRAFADTPEASALQREAEIYQKLDRRHAEHVPHVVDAKRTASHYFLVMERAETDLEKHVRTTGSVSTTEAKAILAEIIEGLRELHSFEIVHRDLKPSNILRIRDRWVLADFGISKDARASVGGTTFRLRGTTGYAAPEQILTGVEANASMDIFALGKVAVFLLTGGTDIDRVLFRSWRDVARRCTADDPEQRPSLDQIAREFDELKE